MSSLPERWTETSIGAVCEINPKHSSDLDDALQVSFVPMGSIDEIHGRIGDHTFRPLGEVKKGYTHFADGDVIFAKITPCMENGNCAVAENLNNGFACGSTEFFVFRPNGALEPKYLYRYLRQERFRQTARKAMTGAVGQARVPKQFMENTCLPLPPLNEQRRIVAKLDALFEKSRSIREKLDRLPRLLANLQKSILNSAFRGDLTKEWRANNPNVETATELLKRIRAERRAKWEADLIAKGKDPKKAKYVEPEQVDTEGLPELPEGWCWAPNSLLAEDQLGSICAGPFGTIFKAKDFRTSGIPIIFLRHVGEGKYLTHKPGFMDEEVWKELHQPYSVFGGELLVTKLGDPPGTACIYPREAGVAMVTPDVMKMSVNGRIAEAQYLMHFFNSPVSKGILRELAFGVTRLRIDLAMFKSFPIPLAPREEQKVILHHINELFKKAEKISSNVEVISERLTATSSSVLSKAFRGELVPQDPNDEPASVLLKRIRAQKPAAGTKRGRGRKAAA